MVDVADTLVENRWIVQPNHANTHGTVHGGTVVKWMDEVGAMSAMRFAGEPCVTARIDRVNFRRPIEVGEIALVEAHVYGAGTTSVKVRLRAFAENPLDGSREVTTESFFVYVAVDDDLRPTEVPELTTDSEEGNRLLEAALEGEAAMTDERNGR